MDLLWILKNLRTLRDLERVIRTAAKGEPGKREATRLFLRQVYGSDRGDAIYAHSLAAIEDTDPANDEDNEDRE